MAASRDARLEATAVTLLGRSNSNSATQALSVALQANSDFGRDDYHARHPAGTLGARSEGKA